MGRQAVALFVLLIGCGSAAQANMPISLVPQNVTLTIDASDGGTVSIGGCTPVPGQAEGRLSCSGEVWLDARGGGADSDADQEGVQIDAETRIDPRTQVSATGGTGP